MISIPFGIFTIGAATFTNILPLLLSSYSFFFNVLSSTTPLWQLIYTPIYVDMIRYVANFDAVHIASYHFLGHLLTSGKLYEFV